MARPVAPAAALATSWCEPECRLHAIFDFPHLPAAAQQQAGDAEALCALFAKFVEQAAQQPAEAPKLGAEDHASLAGVVACLRSGLAAWFPEYGCAVLAVGGPVPSLGAADGADGATSASHSLAAAAAAPADLRSQPDHVSLHVVALDEWRLSVHSSSSSAGDCRYQHIAKTEGTPSLMPCGMTLPAAELSGVLSAARALMDQSLRDRRSGEHGFQRTPAFVYGAVKAALQQAWEAKRAGGGAGGSSSSGRGAEVVARGGTADVGLHTGSDTVRATCWPLVRATIQVVLERMGVCGPRQRPTRVFRRALALFHLWLPRRQVALSSSPAAATPLAVTAAVHMLQAAGAKAAGLAAEGEDVANYAAECGTLLARVGAAAAARALQAAEQHTVPPPASHEALGGSVLLPAGVLPELPAAQRAAGGLEAAKQRAAANLGSVALLEPGCSFAETRWRLQQEGWRKPAGDAAAQLVLRTVERELFTRVLSLAGSNGGGSSSSSRSSSSSGTLQSEAELAALVAVVDTYRDALQAFLGTPAAQSAMQCELRSREALAGWCAYCLADEYAARQQPLVQACQPALQFVELWHLVLSDRPAVDAVLAVAAYLHLRRQRAAAGPLLFSLRDGGQGTLAFAADFSATDRRLCDILTRERADAAARVQAHWQLVRQRQEQLRQYEQELAALQLKERTLRAQKARIENEMDEDDWDDDDVRLREVKAELRTNKSRQKSVSAWITSLRNPPEPVLQPLPASDSLARQWLFFLHMPPLFRHLSRLCFQAQQLLLPRPLDSRKPALAAVAAAVTMRRPDTGLVAYYNQRRDVHTYLTAQSQTQHGAEPEAAAVKLFAAGKPPDKVGPSSLEGYTSASDGVWYPDTLQPSMLWAAGTTAADRAAGLPTYFNPFAVADGTAVEEFFTERLPAAAAAAVQWAARQRCTAMATPNDRGNWALARQEDCPPELLSKSEFLQLGRMRAYPLQQLRLLCGLLRPQGQQQALPLTQPAVQALLRQLLFHVGALTAADRSATSTTTAGGGGVDDMPPRLFWRTGWDQPGDVLDALCAELAAQADTLDGKVRDHDAILLLGEMAAYLADWHPPCGAVARRFADITMREAGRLQAELAAAAGDDRRVSELRARQVRWRVMALLCYGAGPLLTAAEAQAAGGEEDAAVMVRLMVQINHGLTFQDDAVALKELLLLRARAHNVMARRVQQLVELIRGGREDAVLTAAVECLERLECGAGEHPVSLPWQQLQQADTSGVAALGSYQAVGPDGRLYSINILDGTVLFDGWRPSRLPKVITQHPLYVRTFGDLNFEVAFDEAAPGALEMRTLQQVRGRRYKFRLCAAAATGGAASSQQQRLVITEEDLEHGGERLELLDAGADSSCKGWGEQLPVRLRELHSHWLSRQRRALVLRPRSFQEHDCAFLASCRAGSSGGGTTIGSGSAAACEYDCRRVPLHLRSRPWLELLEMMPGATGAASCAAYAAATGSGQQQPWLHEQLVLLPDSQVVHTILGKFEDRRFIHAFASVTGGEVSFELPRFGLEFSMQQPLQPLQQVGGSSSSGGGAGKQVQQQQGDSYCQLLSRNYSGYRLRRVQQLAERLRVENGGGTSTSTAAAAAAASVAVTYTLPEFRQYLVLERVPQPAVAPVGSQRAEVMVLVPAGPVRSGGGGGGGGEHGSLVRIALPGGCGAEVKAHRYEVHGRFGHLLARTRLARLQLAALYAATSTLLPEPSSRCTGAQTAMKLLRQCWSTRPLEAEEQEQLEAVGRLGGHLAPGLHLLAHDLAASAVQLEHLHMLDSAAAPTGCSNSSSSGGGGGSAATALDAADSKLVPHLAADHALAYEELLSAAHRSLPPGWGVNPRLLLTATEEERVLGLRLPRDPVASCCEPPRADPITVLESPPVNAGGFVRDTEASMQHLLLQQPAKQLRRRRQRQPYPLAAATVAPRWPLQADMHAELMKSWNAYHSLPDVYAYDVKPGCLQRVLRMQATTTTHRRSMEAHLLQQLERVPPAVGCHGASLRLLRAAAIAPAAAPLDLAAAAVRPELFTELNPFLSLVAVQELRRRVLTWLQLCVLEDRLARVAALAAAHEAGDDCLPQLVQELLVHRTWNAAAHPEWLVFEVESQLQIRPQQHTVARMLMEGGGGDIAQLNMGEGKTRVILPMLLLALADGRRVVSLTFLSTLLDEAYAYLHGALCAGVLGRKLYLMPFHRDVKLTPARVRRMRAALAHCMRERGVLLVSPEQRLSLELKWKEYLLKQRAAAAAGAAGGGYGGASQQQAAAACEAEVAALLTALLQVPLLNILDESDELLHHRFQLIYACGAKTALHALDARAGAICAVLRAVTEMSNDGMLALPHTARVLEPPSDAADEAAAGVDAAAMAAPTGGVFCGLRLLPGAELDAALGAFYTQVAHHVLRNLPFEFQKMARLLDAGGTERVVACVTDADTSAEAALGRQLLSKLVTGPGGAPQLYDFILALRGLLGCGILRHSLLLRHQVEYGIDRRAPTSHRVRTRMAVPYRAAHTPSERSEFAQPDVALQLTHLAYYHDGLSLAEFTAAVEVLLHGLGKEAAADHYRTWLRLSGDSIPPEEQARFADVNQLDASSGGQMAAMHRHLRRNTAVVDFWLRFCVLPAETRQYPQRLGASAWDLAEAGDHVMGFSGTNDNYRLLPLRVHQALPPAQDQVLKATNGKMLHVITQNTLGFHTLPSAEDAGGMPVWRCVLDAALEHGAHALLDCGALLADTTNGRAASLLLADPRLQQLGLRGVTYFDEQRRGWVVLELTGRRLPRDSSPLQEHESFVIYDEARCRGADLKLQRRAVGLLTLGPGICKDKLMQAAGRLRQLGRGQALRVAATEDIAARVLAAGGGGGAPPATAGSTAAPAAAAAAVLSWVMQNTVEANLRGVAHWAAQGLHYATTLGAPHRSVQDEVLGLQELYAGSKALHPVADLVAAAARQARQRCLDDAGRGGGGGGSSSSSSSRGGGGGGSGGGLPAAADKLMYELEAGAACYGKGHDVRAGCGADEECERELEQEVEEEREQERQPPKRKPAPEEDWQSYAAALLAASISALRAAMTGACRRSRDPLQPLLTAVSQLSSLDPARPLTDMAWSDRVYLTDNYLRSIADLPPGAPLNEYLRPVGWLLALEDGAVVLLSEREADQLLAAAWAGRSVAAAAGASATGAIAGSPSGGGCRGADGPLLVSLAYAWQAVAAGASHHLQAAPPLLATNLGLAAAGGEQGAAASWSQLRQRLTVRELVSVRVFAGETSYHARPAAAGAAPGGAVVNGGGTAAAAAEVAKALRQLVEGCRPQMQQLLVMRGQQSQMTRSDLEKAVEGLPLQLV